jgi:hypothetical protein
VILRLSSSGLRRDCSLAFGQAGRAASLETFEQFSKYFGRPFHSHAPGR